MVQGPWTSWGGEVGVSRRVRRAGRGKGRYPLVRGTLSGSLCLIYVSNWGHCCGDGGHLLPRSLQKCEYLLLSPSSSITANSLLPAADKADTTLRRPTSRPNIGNLMTVWC